MAEIELSEFMKKAQKYTPRTNEKLVKVAEYAKMSHLSAQAVTAQLRSGQLDGIRIGSQWRVRIIDEPESDQAEIIADLRAELEKYKTLIECMKSLILQG